MAIVRRVKNPQVAIGIGNLMPVSFNEHRKTSFDRGASVVLVLCGRGFADAMLNSVQEIYIFTP
eukprot:scaffold6062_cov74-Cyclotella_meneghiniana.AAC.6